MAKQKTHKDLSWIVRDKIISTTPNPIVNVSIFNESSIDEAEVLVDNLKYDCSKVDYLLIY